MLTETSAKKRPFHVVLAEDDREMRIVLAQALHKSGYHVTECSDGLGLLDQLGSWLYARDVGPEEAETQAIDVVISDVRMPGVNGLSILEGIQGQPGIPAVILITAFGDKATHEQAHRWGAKAVFDKPFDVDDLLQSVHDIVSPPL